MGRGLGKQCLVVDKRASSKARWNIASVHALRRRLRDVVVSRHPTPRAVHQDDDLLSALLDLYSGTADEIWSEYIEPFLRQHERALDLVYSELDSSSCSSTVFDTPESVLVLERLEHDGLRLADSWPLAPIELERVAASWGVPVR